MKIVRQTQKGNRCLDEILGSVDISAEPDERRDKTQKSEIAGS